MNYATENLTSNKDFKYAIIVNSESWKLMQYNSDIMQHFLLTLYHS